jgi:ATP-dependent helicase/nuclease subunit A
MAVGGHNILSSSEKLKHTPTKEQRRAADPNHSVWVAASAGSGKTQVLVDRVIRLLLEGAAPDAILCLTFTKAAAAEMSNRLFKRLSDWIGLDDNALTDDLMRLGLPHVDVKTRNTARRLFARALETPGGLKIQTIHAFCERLLQLFPVESGMAPGFRVMEEQETKDLFRSALLQSLSSDDASTLAAWTFLDDGSISNLEILEKLAAPFLSGSNGMRQRLSDMDKLEELETALKSIFGSTHESDAHSLTVELCDIDTAAYQDAATQIGTLEDGARFETAHVLRAVLNAKMPELRCAELKYFAFQDSGKQRPNFLRGPAVKKLPALHAWLTNEAERIAPLVQKLSIQQILEANLAIYRAMAGVMARVNLTKRARGLYDFDDLIARTAKLLEGHEAAQWVLYKLDKGLTHILVDEAQDTSPAQWTIIKALAGEFFSGEGDIGVKRTVFAVGDLKQSIYSFQGADISAFEAARSSFSKTLHDAQDPLQEVDLAISYRSNQHILNAVDQVFAPGRAARSGFGPRADVEPEHTAYAKERVGLVEIWDLIMPDENEVRDNWRAPVGSKSNSHPRLKLAKRIARTIKSWLGTRHLTGQNKKVDAGDILILLQSRNDLFHALLGALRRHDVPVAGADRLKLQDSLIVQDLIMLGQIIRMPHDDHAVACILKSPLVPEPLNEEQLFTLAYGRETVTLLDRLDPGSANAKYVQEIITSSETPYLLFARVLRENRRNILERLGQEADDAGQEFLTLALDYEQKHGTSLSGFLDWMSRGETQIKREMQADAGLVRLMTVHGAKGLEAPIVFLADAADPPPTKRDRLLKVTEEGPWRGLVLFEPKTLITPPIVDNLKLAAKTESLNERLRLLYVGMTRAADELYICGSLNKDDENKVHPESWFPQIQEAIASNIKLPDLRRIIADDGLNIMRFGAEPVFGVPRQATQPIPDALPTWSTTPLPKSKAKPPQLGASRNSDAFDKQAVEEGIATHKLIEMMADAPLAMRREEGTRWAKRLKLHLPLVDRLHMVLQHPDLAVFFNDEAQSEVAIGGANGFSGRIDRMVVADDCIYLLDYKTNRHPLATIGPNHLYALQMANYAKFLKLAFPDHSLKAALLWTQTGAVTWISHTVLSQALERSPEATA